MAEKRIEVICAEGAQLRVRKPLSVLARMVAVIACFPLGFVGGGCIGHFATAGMVPEERLWAVVTCAIVGGVAFVWFFSNRVRTQQRLVGPRRCVFCGYDLHGNTSGVCPECGEEVAFHHERIEQGASDGPVASRRTAAGPPGR